MEETKSGISPTGLVILLVLLFLFMRQGGLFGNGFGCGNGFPGFGCNFAPWALNGAAGDIGFQNYKATCDAEKTEIINTARTQYLTEQQSAQTRELVQSTANTTQAKIDFYAYQDLRDKLSESQRENMMLQNKLFVKDQLEPVNSALASIQCKMLRRPDVTGIGAVCPNSAIINGLGINSLGCCGSTVIA